MDPPLALSEFKLQKFENQVRFCSEVKIGKDILRCHLCFQSDGAMYNWMTADVQDTVYECRLAAVVVSTDELVNTNDGLNLVVQWASIRCFLQNGFGQVYIMSSCHQMLSHHVLWFPSRATLQKS
jgi:hypothetical protein